MQQVGRQHFLNTAQAVDPRRLPVPIRHRRRALVGVRHLWVLHKRRASRLLVLALVMVLLLVGYAAREDIAEGTLAMGHLADTLFVSAGFGISQISISGQTLTREAQIFEALAIAPDTATLTYDVDAARGRLEDLPAIKDATLRKVYPDRIEVSVDEKDAVARWRQDGETVLVDAGGTPIADAVFDDADLMLVIGDGAGDDALPMINLLGRYPEISTDIAALSRIGDRRWDLIYYTGLRVQLPEKGVAAALQRLDRYQREHQLLDRDVSSIDMRLPEFVAVRPIEREDTDQ